MTPRARLDREQVRAVDRFATEALAIPSLLLMENAGRNAAEVVLGLCRGRRHARVGVPVTLMTLAVSGVYLALRF